MSLANQLLGRLTSPTQAAVRAEMQVRLQEALNAMDPLDREVLSLRFEEELSLPQLAATLGVPVPTAKARLYRALGRLRAALLAKAPAGEWR